MKVTLTNGNCSLTENFPKKPLELLDILDRLHQTGNRTVDFEFDCYYEEVTPPSELTEKTFTADIFALNVFTERLVNMTPPERAVYQAVVQKNPVFRFEDAVQMTFGLESVPVIKASNFSELGEFVIENDMIPEVQGCPNELVQFLDRAKIGRLMADQYNGVFVGDYYCEPENYEKPDILIEFGEPKPHIFRFLLTPDANHSELAEWTSLPCNDSLLENKICFQGEFINTDEHHHTQQYQNRILAETACRLLENLSKMIEEDYDSTERTLHSQTDSKIRRIIQKKKQELGIKSSDFQNM